ncbi:hypothetical protein [Chryseobacterium sp.]|uniref:hypothetical protein n=1 Tax=Chryseobacterium sp. TaxID=1871047 RepID=UPI0011CBB4DC|nr:hypothetical protein [Chryseobacterium sp.]TXF77326.1 hypothetical protein FUA25_05180 [Chryseobacterium sp.]
MNRFFTYLFLLFCTGLAAQPVTITPYSSGFASLTSYNGAVINNHTTILLAVQGSDTQMRNNWSVRFRVNGTISNGTDVFPANKLKFQFNNFTYAGTPPSGTPTNTNLGLVTTPLVFATSNKSFQSSPTYSLTSTAYFSITFNYNLIIDGGAYLAPLISWNNYTVNLIMEVRDRQGTIKDSKPFSFPMQIHPNDFPPSSPSYGISLSAAAKSVLMEFKTKSDYDNGVTKTINSAFSTFSNTPYIVQIGALNTDLTSPTNKTLPVNSINLSVKNAGTSVGTGNINLSTNLQTILTNSVHTGSKSYDMTYYTQPADIRFINRSYEQYSGTLIIGIMPQ